MKSLFRSIDQFFFGTSDEEDSDMKLYFYGALLFGMIVTLITIVKIL